MKMFTDLGLTATERNKTKSFNNFFVCLKWKMLPAYGLQQEALLSHLPDFDNAGFGLILR